jgi:hypothetical protein
MKVHKNTDDLHKEISELKDTLEGFKKLVEVQRKEIFDLKKYVSEDIKNKNLLQGYKQRPSVRAPLNLLKEIFTCTVVHASRSLWLKA